MTESRSTLRLEPLTEAAAGILQGRGIDLEVAVRYGVQSVIRRRPRAPGDWRELIAFPHYRDETVIHYEYRTIGPGDLDCFQSKDGNRSFWNENVLRDRSLYGGALIITEGRLDALACIQSGFPATISVCDGAPPPPKNGSPARTDPEPKLKYSYVLAALPLIHEFKSVILATDADNAGAMLLEDLARIIGRARCRWVNYRGAKDSNALLQQSGEAALVEAISTAKPIQVPGLYTYDDLPPSPEYPAVACGIEGLDDLWRLRVGENTIVVGMPQSGKTTLFNCVACGLGELHGWVTAFFTPEQPTSVHKRRLLHRRLGKPPRQASELELRQAIEWVTNHFVWFHPSDDASITVDWFCEMVEAAAIRHNIKLVIADPWNELEHDWPMGVTETDYIGRMLKKINQTSRRAGVHTVIAVHPTKLARRKDGGYDAPDGYNCNGGANWFNKAYIGLSIHRIESNRTEVTNWKSKFQDEGNYAKTGKVMLGYNGWSNKFEYVPPDVGSEDDDQRQGRLDR